ncbi:MAG: histidinol-phosphate transaminase [bacterium]|nr:histidinol-phosphate transaminase [bacterium]
MMSLISRVPQHVLDLIPYPPGKPVEEVEREYGISNSIKLASNECPIGPSPKAIEAVSEALDSLNIYPDGSGYYLKEELSERLYACPENIILGNGSNEIIELIARAFMEKGDEAVMGDPAFIVYQLITKAVGGNPVPVPLVDFTHDLPAMAAAVGDKTKLLFIANPNNPTGTVVKKARLESLLESVPGDVLIVMDEAYHEYSEASEGYETSLSYLDKYPNLIILRTFSKAYGLAGLRVGYGIASREVISVLERVRQPFNINSLALAGARAALDDFSHIEKGLKVNSEGMNYLYSELGSIGLSYVKSYANFVLFDAAMDGGELCERLMKKGVIARPMAGYGLKTHIRITVGLPGENERFIEALKECIS